MEPTTTGVVSVGESLKGSGIVPIVMVVAMTLSTLVVLCMRRPITSQEWVIGIISTLVSSLCGGAAFIMHMGLQEWADSFIGLMAVGGILFSCGLPGWAFVRLFFNSVEANKGKTIKDVVQDVKEVI